MIVGRVKEIWRYPVKSMAGERLQRSAIDPGGLPGDRCLGGARREARRDPRSQEDPGPDALPCALRRVADAASGRAFPRSRCPTARACARTRRRRGARLRRGRHRRDAVAAAARGRARPLPPRRARSRRHGDRAARDVRPRRRTSRCRTSAPFRPSSFQYESPPGTYFDAFPLLAAHDRLAGAAGSRVAPRSRVDVRRFRPNLLIETERDLDGYVEMRLGGPQAPRGRARARVHDRRARAA